MKITNKNTLPLEDFLYNEKIELYSQKWMFHVTLTKEAKTVAIPEFV